MTSWTLCLRTSWTVPVFARFMSSLNPDPRVRLAVVNWPEDAPRGAVAMFCRKHKVSRAWFYKVRELAAAQGAGAAMELKSTRPVNSPAKTDESMRLLLLATRAGLEGSGWDHGPLSVIAKLERQGVKTPAVSTVGRVFTQAGVVIAEPRKRPHSSYKRFTYPEPNGCWQIDATEWVLANNTKVVIFQIIDDHLSRCEHVLRRRMKPAQKSMRPRQWNRKARFDVFGKARVISGGKWQAMFERVTARRHAERTFGGDVNRIGLGLCHHLRQTTIGKQRQSDFRIGRTRHCGETQWRNHGDLMPHAR